MSSQESEVSSLQRAWAVVYYRMNDPEAGMAEPMNALAAAGPAARRLYGQLIEAIKPIGPFREEIKKTSIHLARNTAFAGVHPRKEYLVLTIKAEKPLRSPRVAKAEQVSKNRWHLDIKLASADEIDGELLGWLRRAYDLCA